MNETALPTDITCGSITAPAGCGKTHLVAQAIADHKASDLPLLVLTHTNAGVAALRKRVEKLGVSPKRARIATLDGWSLKLLGSFPLRGETATSHLQLNNPKNDYPAIRIGALNIINNGHIREIIKSTYAHLIVDEYQDCQPDQHEMIKGLSRDLPTCVLGDPLQSIFNFTKEGTVDWDNDVLTTFPQAAELTEPWRWKLAGNEKLGKWLLTIRQPLIDGKKIDLQNSPDCVEWICLDGIDDWTKQLSAANTKSKNPNGGSLIMAKWPNDQAEFARKIPGASKVENADLSELQTFASKFSVTEDGCLTVLVNFAASVMTGINKTALNDRLTSIIKKTNRSPPSDVEAAILEFHSTPSHILAATVLSKFSRDVGVRVFRPELLRTAIKALNAADAGQEDALLELALSIRDQMRFSGRSLPRKAVGSTLLFKGLEADVSIILDAETMDHRDLYVALTRGCQKIVVCSKSPILPCRG